MPKKTDKNDPKKLKCKKRLGILAGRLTSTDKQLVHLLARRIAIAKEVAMVKMEGEEGLYRPKIEKTRLTRIANWAREEGINPEFARAVLYGIIGESCKQQIALTDRLRLKRAYEKFEPTLDELHTNLIKLTKGCAKDYEAMYDKGHPATKALRDFERSKAMEIIKELPHRNLMLDLGCATGLESRHFSEHFMSLRGFDISPAMIERGRIILNKETAEGESPGKIQLDVHDVEQPLPIEDSSVSFILMNGGTGSDVPDIQAVLEEIERVLVPGGHFLVSFYNKAGWAQRIFFPWPLGLAANVDQDRGCLEVNFKGKPIPIFAKPYTLEEVKEMIPNDLAVCSTHAYPTLQSVLPTEVMQNGCAPILEEIDRRLAESPEMDLGAYLIIHGKKPE